MLPGASQFRPASACRHAPASVPGFHDNTAAVEARARDALFIALQCLRGSGLLSSDKFAGSRVGIPRAARFQKLEKVLESRVTFAQWRGQKKIMSRFLFATQQIAERVGFLKTVPESVFCCSASAVDRRNSPAEGFSWN